MSLLRFSPQRDSTVELSEEAIQFLTNLFKRYDKVSCVFSDLRD